MNNLVHKPNNGRLAGKVLQVFNELLVIGIGAESLILIILFFFFPCRVFLQCSEDVRFQAKADAHLLLQGQTQCPD